MRSEDKNPLPDCPAAANVAPSKHLQGGLKFADDKALGTGGGSRGVLPAQARDDIGRVVLHLAGQEEPRMILSADERAAINRSKAAAARGEFASDEQMRAVWAKHGL